MLLINTVHGGQTKSLMNLCRIHQIYFAWENTRNVNKAKMFYFGHFTMKSLMFSSETILVENKSLLMLNKGTSFQQYRKISSQTKYLIKSRTLWSFFFLKDQRTRFQALFNQELFPSKFLFDQLYAKLFIDAVQARTWISSTCAHVILKSAYTQGNLYPLDPFPRLHAHWLALAPESSAVLL